MTARCRAAALARAITPLTALARAVAPLTALARAAAPLAALAALPAHALPDGAPWEAAGEGCVQCHFDAPAIERSAAVAIDGLPERIEPGTEYRLVVRLDDAQMRKAGFMLSAFQGGAPAGSFAAADARAAVNGAQARSTAAGAAVPASGAVEWTLTWAAPSDADTAPVRFDLWANAGNDDASPLGDQTHHRAWQVPVTSSADETRIVFLAGPKDHGFPGRHDYEKDLRVLASALERAPNLNNVTTSVYVGKAPRDLAEIADADVFVIESSSDRAANETHPLFPPDPLTDHTGYDAETKAYLDEFDALVKAGAGIVLLHYTTWAENWDAREYYLAWTGGLWVQIGSKNPVDDWAIELIDRTHPVLRGVEPWTYRDEIFSRFFLPNDSRRTDLLLGTPQQDRLGIGPQVVAWAYQRDDGGRGFVFGGVDYHDNMLVDDYRRFLLNGIVWAAGLEVPAGGVQSEDPEGIEPYVAPALPRR